MSVKRQGLHPNLLDTFVFLVLGSFVIILLYSVLQLEPNNGYNRLPVKVDLSHNYFGRLKQQDFLVDYRKCRIPKFDVLNDHVQPFYKKYDREPFCNMKSNPSLTFVDGQFIRVSNEALSRRGFHKDNVTCCYRTVNRIEQSLSLYDHYADNGHEFSEKCYPIGNNTIPISSFIKVTCSEISHEGPIYTGYHLVAVFPAPGRSGNISRKLEYWEQCQKHENKRNTCSAASWNNGRRPLSVFIIGLDSTSRLNFRRSMPKTTAVLEDKLEAVEMKGYTKVGDNTFPNFVPIMSSLTVKELISTCYPTRWTPFDNCPFIWKEFSKRNYLTAHIEDFPDIAIFNYERTGFIHAPVDMYPRNWIIPAYQSTYFRECRGSREQELLDFAVNLAALSESRGMPFFILTWLTELTHGDMNAAQALDSKLASILLDMKSRGLLESTLVIVMGDHGYRFGDYRSTIAGWYEDKLPALWIKVPEKLFKESEALRANSDKLTSPFDIHATFRNILSLSQTNATGHRGLSLLKQIPERSCKQAGVPLQFCPCETPVAYGNKSVIRGAKAAVMYMNDRIPTDCRRLQLDLIFAAGRVRGEIDEEEKGSFYLHIGFVTQPGEFRFEALVEYENEDDDAPLRVVSVQRTNKITRSVRCLDTNKDNEFEFTELICFCKRTYFF